MAMLPAQAPHRANEGVVDSSRPLQGKRIVSEKRPECFPGPGRVPELSEEETDHLVAFRRGRRMQIAITMDNKEKVSAL